jgi:hypothetical protein
MALVFEFMIIAIGTKKPTHGKSTISVSTLKLTVRQWQQIREDLHTEHPKSVFMLKDKMRRVLGFTVREHNEWVIKPDGGYGDHSIRLDFYNERKYTMFMLKYSEYLK